MKPRGIFAWALVALVVAGGLGGAPGREAATAPMVTGDGRPAVPTSTPPAAAVEDAAHTPAGPRPGSAPETSAQRAEALTITLTGERVASADMLAADSLGDDEIAVAPLLTADDFLAYDVASHVFTLTVEAAERVAALDVPTNGRSFILAVGGTPIYAGAFWAPYSSLSYDGVVIMILPGYTDGPGFAPESGTFRLELGYPGSSFFSGSDPRSDPRVVDALVRLGIAR